FEDNHQLTTSAYGAWARQNRLRKRVDGGHGFLKLFPVAEFGESHPEFYPLINGRRFIPPPGPRFKGDRSHYLWQPNFSAPGIVEAAALRIQSFFEETPGLSSVSLGINDGNDHYDESPASLARRHGGRNSMGYMDVS